MRKALQTEQGKGDMEGRIGTLEADTKDFERQVRVAALPAQATYTRCHISYLNYSTVSVRAKVLLEITN